MRTMCSLRVEPPFAAGEVHDLPREAGIIRPHALEHAAGHDRRVDGARVGRVDQRVLPVRVPRSSAGHQRGDQDVLAVRVRLQDGAARGVGGAAVVVNRAGGGAG